MHACTHMDAKIQQEINQSTREGSREKRLPRMKTPTGYRKNTEFSRNGSAVCVCVCVYV